MGKQKEQRKAAGIQALEFLLSISEQNYKYQIERIARFDGTEEELEEAKRSAEDWRINIMGIKETIKRIDNRLHELSEQQTAESSLVCPRCGKAE